MAATAGKIKKFAENLGSTLKKATPAALAGGLTVAAFGDVVEATNPTPDVVIVNEKDENDLSTLKDLLYILDDSRGGGGGTNVSEPETGNGGGFNIMDYLPWIAGLLGVGLIVYLLFDKKKGRR